MPTYSPAPVPVDSNPLGGIVAAGLGGLVLVAILVALGFVLSAWIAGLWLRLMVRFHRSWFDRECARARGAFVPAGRGRRPASRDWGGQGPTFFS